MLFKLGFAENKSAEMPKNWKILLQPKCKVFMCSYRGLISRKATTHMAHVSVYSKPNKLSQKIFGHFSFSHENRSAVT